jgi:CheY-like chemotaxis protein
MKILVVDDEPLICEEFRDILEEEGHEVDTAKSGQEGIDKIKGKEYDLVFLDVLMPRMEGREAFEAIKKVSKVPVAIMSGYLPPNKEREILALGAVACFRKPLELDRVRGLVNSIKLQKSN